MTQPVLRAVGIAGGTVAAALVVATVTFIVANGWTPADAVESYALSNLVNGASLAICGTLLALARPRNVLGWLLLVGGLAYLLSAAAIPASVYAAEHSWPDPLIAVLAGLGVSAWSVAIGLALPFALLLFPTGRLSNTPERVAAVIVGVSGLGFVGLFGGVFARLANAPSDVNPLSAPGFELLAVLWSVVSIASTAIWFALLARLVFVYIRGSDTVRRQVLWVALAALIAYVVSAPLTLFGFGDNAQLLVYTLIPVAILIAVLRHRLLDITLVFSRALAWSLLTAVVVLLYISAVALLSLVLQSTVSSIIVALLVALAFEPLRRLLQRVVDRLLYGRRSEPVHVMQLVTREVSSGGESAELLGRLAASLRLPWLSLEIDGLDPVTTGKPVESVVEFPLVQDEQQSGRLVVGVRPGQSGLTRSDRDVLELVAPVLALLAGSRRLTQELIASRRRVVDAAEAERLRVQRELHDGVASAITGLSFKLEAAAELVDDRAALRPVLSVMRADVAGIHQSIRAVINDLRPHELDSAGLVAALRQRTAAISSAGRRVDVVLRGGKELPTVSPSVEAAAYRICTEAVSNALRHSGGGQIAVHLWSAGDRLMLKITDDGRGSVAEWKPGVGIPSMQERAELLGGA
ncbi:MAG TPA: histidine kinase, partial [Agromyces sp.]|nr:histidine kinase [Agromyces sp.]